MDFDQSGNEEKGQKEVMQEEEETRGLRIQLGERWRRPSSLLPLSIRFYDACEVVDTGSGCLS